VAKCLLPAVGAAQERAFHADFRKPTSVAEDISRNLTEITSIASTNLDNVQRTEAASNNLHGLSGQLNEVTARLSA